jgi:AcrR family transcriptional regulator
MSGGRGIQRDELLDAARRAVRRSGHGVTMHDIAAEAGISKPILYRHFGDKAGLYRALADVWIDRIVATIQEGLVAEPVSEQITRRLIDAYLETVEHDCELYRVVVVEASTTLGEGGYLTDRVANALVPFIEVELRRNDTNPALAWTWAHGVVGYVRQVADWWLRSRAVSRDEVVDQITTALWHGLESAAFIDAEANLLAP